MTGPVLYSVADDDWTQFLKEQSITAWYCVTPATQPGAFSKRDDADQADAGDEIYAKASVLEAAKRGLPWAEDLLGHEYLHCLEDWTPTPKQELRVSHPTTPGRAIWHAIRVGFAVNAFTRLLRCRQQPLPELNDFRAWLHGAEVHDAMSQHRRDLGALQ